MGDASSYDEITNLSSGPVTLNYSKLIARMVIELGIQNWNQIITEGKLRDKSWFL